MAGAVDYLALTSRADAALGDNVTVTAAGGGGEWTADLDGAEVAAFADAVAVRARAEVASLGYAGNGSEGGRFGLGGSLAWQARSTTASATLGAGAQVAAADGGLDLEAVRVDRLVTVTGATGAAGEAATLGVGAAVAVARLAGEATAEVDEAATIDVHGRLNVGASAETTVDTVARSRMTGAGRIGLTGTLAYTDVAGETRARLAADSRAGEVRVAAVNLNRYNTEAHASTEGQVALGFAAALADVDLAAAAELGGTVETVADEERSGDVTVYGASETTGSSVIAETAVAPGASQAPADSEDPDANVDGEVAAEDHGTTSFVQGRSAAAGSKVDAKADQGTGSGGGAGAQLKLGAAVALSTVEQSAAATVLDGAGVTAPTAGDIAVVAHLSDRAVRTQAVAGARSRVKNGSGTTGGGGASGGGTTVAAAGAVALEFRTDRAEALVGRGVTLQAGRIGVGAEAELPFSADLSWGDFLNLQDIFAEFKAGDDTPLTDRLREAMRGYASASVDAGTGDIGLAGSVNYGQLDVNARAWIGDGSNVTATGALEAGGGEPGWSSELAEGVSRHWRETVAVEARTEARSLEVAGNLASLFDASSGSGSKAVLGGSFNWVDRGGETVAGIGADVEVEADSVGVRAERLDQVVAVTPGAGKGAGITGTGMVSFSRIGGATHASLSHSAKLTTAALTVDAAHDLSLWSVAGAVSLAENAGIGIALAINDLQADTRAWIGDNADDAPFEETVDGAGLIQADAVTVTAASRGSVAAAAVAGAAATGSSGTRAGSTDTLNGKTDAAVQQRAGAAEGRSVAAADDPALEESQSSLTERSAWRDTDGAQGTQPANSDAAGSRKGGFGLSLAGAATVNFGELQTRAEVREADIRGRAGGTVDLTVRAITDADMLGFAGGAALTRGGGGGSGFKAAIAGSLAFNHLRNTTEALLVDSIVSGADDVAVEALTAGDQIAVGLGIALTAGAQNAASAAGSVSIGYLANTTTARMEGSELRVMQGDLDLVAYDRSRIANGGGALSIGGKAGVGAAVTVGLVENTLEAAVDGGLVDGAASVDVEALSGMQVLGGAAMAAAVAGSSGAAVSGAAVYHDVANTLTARIGGGARIGTGDYSLAGGGTQTAAAVGTVTVRASGTTGVAHLDALVAARAADADTQFDLGALLDPSRGETRADPTDGTEPGEGYEVDDTDLAAPTHTGEAVVGIAGNLSAGGAASLGLSFVGNFVDSRYTAEIAEADVVSDDTVAVTAGDRALVAGLAVGLSASSGQFAGMGSVTVNRIASEALARVGDAGLGRTAIEAAALTIGAAKGADIYALAGSVAFSGQAGIGAAVGYNEVASRTTAALVNADVEAADKVSVSAGSDADIYSAAVSGAASQGVALGGSVNVNRIDQRIGASVVDAGVDARALEVLAGDTDGGAGADIWAFSGDIKGGGQAAVGVSLATNIITSGYAAEVSGAELVLDDALDVRARSAGNIRTLAVSGGASSELAAGAAAATGHFEAATTARLADTEVEAGNADVLVAAADDSQIQTFSASLQVGGFAGAAGAATVNTLNNTVRAGIDGVPTGARVHGGDVVVEARSQAGVGTVAMGAAGGGKAGLSGSVATSVLRTVTDAYIGGGADVLAEGNVGVFARSDNAVGAAAGSVGIGGVAVGAAGSVTVNIIETDTTARISDAGTRVQAKAVRGSLTAGTGALTETPSGNPFAEILDVEAGSEDDQPRAEDFAGYTPLDLGGETRSVRGVVVDALSLQRSDTALASLGVSANVVKGGAGLAAAVNTTVLGGATRALVEEAAVGDAGAPPGAYSNLTVVSGHHSYATDVVLGLAAGSEGAMGAVDTAVFEGRSVAAVRDAEVHIGGDVDIDAVSSRGLLGVSAGAAVGTYVGAAGSGGVTVFRGETLAEIIGASVVEARHVALRADSASRQQLVAAGFAGSGVVAAAGTFAVAVSDSVTTARIGDGASGRPEVEAAGNLTVEAENRTEIDNTVASAAAAGAGAIAGAVSAPIVINQTTAAIRGADVTTGAHVRVSARDVLDVGSAAGGGAISLNAAGAAGVNIGVIKSRTLAEIAGGAVVTAGGDVAVTAEREADVALDTYLASGAIGSGPALSGGIAVLVLGEALENDVSDQLEGDLGDELGAGDGNWLGKGDAFTGEDHLSGDGDRTEGTLDGESRDYGAVGAVDLTGVVYSTAEDSTTARIDGAAVHTPTKTVKVEAVDRTHTRNHIGSFALGGTAIGGSVAVTQVNSAVRARVNATELDAMALRIDALSTNGAGSAVDVRSITGAAGLVGLGAAVAVGLFDGSVSAELDGAADVGGNVTVQARDEAGVASFGLGAEAGAAAAGVVVAVAERQGRVTAAVGGSLARASNLSVLADSRGSVHAESVSAAGGLGAAASAGGAFALERTTVTAGIETGADLAVGGRVDVEAAVVPQAVAEAYGAAVAGNVAIGAVVAEASVRAEVEASLADGAVVEAHDLHLLARAMTPSSGSSAQSTAVAGSGGLLGGANATVALADNETTVTALLAGGATVRSDGDVTVEARNNSEQDATATGVSLGGILALGAAVATAESHAVTVAALDGRVEGRSADSAPALVEVRAFGDDDNYADATSGSGGTIAAAAAVAGTDNRSSTKAYLHRGGAPGGQALRADDLWLDATHVARFNGTADSLQAAVLGMSGAVAEHDVNADVAVEFGAGAKVQTLSLVATASNRIIKTDIGDYNAQGASGGAFTGAAVGSYTDIVQDTEIKVGAGAVLEVLGDYRDPGLFDFTAYNEIYLRDRTRLDTGGAITVALAESKADVERSRADVTIEAGAVLDSVGDINLAGYAEIDLLTRANAKTYGIAAAAAGDSESRVNASQTITVGDNAGLRADGSIRLMAGRNAAGNSNDFEVLARTDVWNKTAVPITDVDALADVDQQAKVVVRPGAAVRSVRDVHLLAVEGGIGSSGIATGTDLYRKALEDLGRIFNPGTEMSLSIRKGESELAIEREVRVDGRVETGIQNHQYVTFDWDAEDETLEVDASEGVSYRVLDETLAQNMQARLDELYRLKEEYSGHPTLPAIYQAEINQIQQRLQEFGARIYQIEDHEGNIIGVSVESDVRVKMIELDPMLASPGDIFVEGRRLVGSGELIAPGDARIDVINNSPYFLRVRGLEIPDYEAGRVVFNQSSVRSNAELNDLQGGSGAAFVTFETAATSPEPSIVVRNTYNPGSVGGDSSFLPPDIYVVGDVSNLRGTLTLSSAAGSVVAEGDLSAKTVNITAGRNFVLSYTEGFRHLGGDPKGIWDDFADVLESSKQWQVVSDCEDGYFCWRDRNVGEEDWTYHSIPINGDSHTVAGNNVFISARYLNINGTIQSGIPDWELDLSGLESRISSAESEFRARGGAGDPLFEIASWYDGKVKAWWNADLDRIEIDGIKVEGGYMELLGEIMNTGGGTLKVLDGFGRIEIDNPTDYDLVLNGLDVGHGVEGAIRITDLGRTNSHGEALVTLYKRIGNEIRVYDNNSVDGLGNPSRLIETSAGRSGVEYTPQAGLWYYWVRGQNKQEKEKRRWEKSSATFFDLFSLSWLIPDDYEDYKKSWTWYTDPRPLLEGDYLGHGSGPYGYTYDYEEVDVADWTAWGNWRTGDYCSKHFIGCVERTYWAEASRQKGVKDIHTHGVRADYPIAIEFIGYDSGYIEVSSDGRVLLNGTVRNPEGDVVIRGAAIERIADTAVVLAEDLTLDAERGIGTKRAILTEVSGLLFAETHAGDVVLEDIGGDLRVLRAETGAGAVVLSAQDNLLTVGSGRIRGDDISLTARQGGIGTEAAAVNIDTAVADDGLFRATASGGIYVTELDGDLRLESVTAGGDVRIETVSGRIMDANTAETRDERTEAELLALWDDMKLTGTEAQAAAEAMIEAYERGKDAEYRQYWRLRNLRQEGGDWVADAYDPDFEFHFDAAEAAELRATLGLDDAGLAELEQARTEQYHALHAQFGEPSAYDPDFRYQVSAAERAELMEGAAWTENELRYSIGSGVLSGGSDTDTRIEDPNIVGRNVTLIAGGASIGSTLAEDVVIDLNQPLTDAQRLALSTAEKDDLVFEGDDIVRVIQREDLDVHASGTITASAEEEIFLGGELDINVSDVRSPVVRIKTGRSIIGSRADAPVVRADELILEAGSGAIIGAVDGALHVAVAEHLAARADDALRLVQHGGDLVLDELFTRDEAVLTVLDGGLSWNAPGGALQADSLRLDTQGSVGALGEALPVRLADGFSGNVGGDLFLTTADAELSLGALEVDGLVSVVAAGGLTVTDDLRAGGDVDLSAGEAWRLNAGVGLTSLTGDVYAQGGSIVMGEGARIAADGRIGLVADDGDAELAELQAGADDEAALSVQADGAIRAVGDGHRLQAAGRARLEAGGDIGAASAPVVVDAPRLDAEAAGAVHLRLARDVSDAHVAAGGELALRALGDLGYQSLTAGGTLTVHGDGRVSGVFAEADGDVAFDAAELALDTVESLSGNVDLKATAEVEVQRLSAAGAVDVTADSAALEAAEAGTTLTVDTDGDQDHGTLHSGGAMRLIAGGDLNYDRLTGEATLEAEVAGQAAGTEADFLGSIDFGGAGGYTLGSVESRAGDVTADVGGGFTVATLRTPAGLIDVRSATAALADAEAGESVRVETRDGQDHGRDALRFQAGADFRAHDLESQTAAIDIDAAFAAVEFGDALTEIRIDTTGGQAHGQRDEAAGGYLHADDLIALTAGGDVRFRELRAGHDGDDPATGGDVVIESHEGSIYGRLAKASRDIHLLALKGGLFLERLEYGGSYTLRAGRDIVAGIGGDFDSRDGELRAGRDVHISTLGTDKEAGDILLGGVIAESGDIVLDAAGDIVVAVDDSGATPTSGELHAGGDIIARSGGSISFERTVSAGGDVTLDAVDAVLVDVIESAGAQDITAGGRLEFTGLKAGGAIEARSGADTVGERVEAGAYIDMTAGHQADGGVAGADLRLDFAAAPRVSLRTAEQLIVERMEVGEQMRLQGRLVESDVLHTGTQLAAYAAGGNGGLSDRLRLDIASGGAVAFSSLYTRDGRVSTSADHFAVADGWVDGWLGLRTARTHLYVNNLVPAAVDVDVQIYEPDTRLRLRVDGLDTWTDGYVSHYRAGHRVESPNFSEQRGRDQLEVGGRSVERETEQALHRGAADELQALEARRPPSVPLAPARLIEQDDPGGAVNLGLSAAPAEEERRARGES